MSKLSKYCQNIRQLRIQNNDQFGKEYQTHWQHNTSTSLTTSVISFVRIEIDIFCYCEIVDISHLWIFVKLRNLNYDLGLKSLLLTASNSFLLLRTFPSFQVLRLFPKKSSPLSREPFSIKRLICALLTAWASRGWKQLKKRTRLDWPWRRRRRTTRGLLWGKMSRWLTTTDPSLKSQLSFNICCGKMRVRWRSFLCRTTICLFWTLHCFASEFGGHHLKQNWWISNVALRRRFCAWKVRVLANDAINTATSQLHSTTSLCSFVLTQFPRTSPLLQNKFTRPTKQNHSRILGKFFVF